MSKEVPSPASSNPFLPQFGLRNRRGSLASISSSPSQLDKDFLAQALDEIHTSASRSQSLTTFNEFASPPPSASGSSDRGIAGTIVQNGLGGLYARLRSSVSARSKDRQSPSPAPDSLRSDSAKVPGAALPRTPRPSPLKHDQRRSNIGSPVNLDLSTGQSEQAADTAQLSIPVTPVFSPLVPNETKQDLARDRSIQKQPDNLHSEANSDKEVSVSTSPASRTALQAELPSPKDRASPSDLSKRDPAANATLEANDGRLEQTGSNSSMTTVSPVAANESLKLPSDPSDTKAHAHATSATSNVQQASKTQHKVPNGITPRSMLTRLEVDPSSVSLMQEMRRKVLSKDFWMRDENAKVCFNCGDSFSTFRRKHHCRMLTESRSILS